MRETGLTVQSLDVAYRRRAVLRGLSLPGLRRGELVALVGPNAAGKSTLLRALARIVASTGTLRWDGQDLQALAAEELAALIGYMPQNLAQDTALTVLESMLAAIPSGPQRGQAARHRALALLERLGIAALALRPLNQLSGGQQQMVGLAQAVVRDPPLLLLDEPTSALDLCHQWQVMHTVRALADAGRLVIAVLHDLALAAQWCDRVVVLQDGRLHSCDTAPRAITAPMLAEVYGVDATVRHDASRQLHLWVRGASSLDPI